MTKFRKAAEDCTPGELAVPVLMVLLVTGYLTFLCMDVLPESYLSELFPSATKLIIILKVFIYMYIHIVIYIFIYIYIHSIITHITFSVISEMDIEAE